MGILGSDGAPMSEPTPPQQVTPESMGLKNVTQQELDAAMKRVSAFMESPDGHVFGAAIIVAHQLFAWARVCLAERNIPELVSRLFSQAMLSAVFNPDGTARPFHGEQLYRVLQNIVLPSVVAETMRRQRLAMLKQDAPDDVRHPEYRFALPFDDLNRSMEGGLKRGNALVLRGTDDAVHYALLTLLRNFSASQHRITTFVCDASLEALKNQVWGSSSMELFLADSWVGVMDRTTDWERLAARIDGTDVLIVERLEHLSDTHPAHEVYRKLISWCRAKTPPVALVTGTEQSDLIGRIRYATEVFTQFHVQPIDNQVGIRALAVGDDIVLAYPESRLAAPSPSLQQDPPEMPDEEAPGEAPPGEAD